jgi:hypothetical protein
MRSDSKESSVFLTSGLCYKHDTIDRMMNVSDASSCGITFKSHSDD